MFAWVNYAVFELINDGKKDMYDQSNKSNKEMKIQYLYSYAVADEDESRLKN